MKVILIVDVKNLGKKGSVVTVADGMALNSLLPTKKAILATKDNLSKLQAVVSDKKSHNDSEVGKLERYMKLIPDSLTIKAKVNEKGNLFQSVTDSTLKNEISNKVGVQFPNTAIVELTPIKHKGFYEAHIRSKDGKTKKSVRLTVE